MFPFRPVLAVTTITTALAACPAASAAPAQPADAFTESVGANVHVMHGKSPYWSLEATRAALKYVGIRHIRDGLRWYTTDEQRWYNAEQVTRLGSLARSGMALDLLMPGPGTNTGTEAQALAVAATLPGVASIEAANEWDLNGPASTWPAEVRAHTKTLRALMRREDKLAQVPLVAPGFGRNGSPAATGDLSGDVDYGNAHPYANGARPEMPEDPGAWGLQRNIEAMRLVSGTRPFVLTEAGYHNAMNETVRQRPVDQATAAVYTTRMLLEHFRTGATRTYLYELADSWNDQDAAHQEANWGLFTAAWKPKPAADAVRNLLNVLRDPAPSPRGAELGFSVTGGDANLRSMVFSRVGGGFTIVLWRPESIWNHATKQPIPVADVPMTVTLGGTFADARVYRPTRGTGAFDTRQNVSTMPVAVGADPVLIDLRTAASPPRRHATAQLLKAWWCWVAPKWCGPRR
ncbi:MAG: hypothetical protein JHC95_16105 [Solirubrobacteraceae bacterium]|nr:hypothetical protein [Solirubrobacteraceae bacterium]